MKELLEKTISNVLEQLNVEDTTIEISIPKNKDNGDYSTNIALKLVKILNKSPLDIAEDIKSKISLDDNILDIKIEKPGFINFFVSNNFLFENINTVNELNKNYGRNDLGNNKKVNLEFVSANPTGYLHLGHARSGFYGSALANIMDFSGYNVTREYYINDAGNQINNLDKSVQIRYKQLCGEEVEFPEDGYHGEEIKTIAKEIFDKYSNTLTEKDEEIFKDFSVEFLLNKIKIDLSNVRVNYDVWSSEKAIYKNNEINTVIDILNNNNNTYVLDDATYINTSDYFDDKDRVIIKSDNTYTYLLPDIAYHANKFQRGYDIIIDVLGADHHGYINRLKSSIKMLGYSEENLEVKILQLVKLIKNGTEVKMSKRSGNSITIEDLIEMIGLTAARYYMVSKSLDSKMDLDIDQMTKQSNDNPIYYIEYANARICSILENKQISKVDKYKTITNENAIDLLKKIYEFEETVKTSAYKREVHILTNYLYSLASLFHSYYNSEKIITEDNEYTNERLNLINAVKIVINNGLNLIEIFPREKM